MRLGRKTSKSKSDSTKAIATEDEEAVDTAEEEASVEAVVGTTEGDVVVTVVDEVVSAVADFAVGGFEIDFLAYSHHLRNDFSDIVIQFPLFHFMNFLASFF